MGHRQLQDGMLGAGAIRKEAIPVGTGTRVRSRNPWTATPAGVTEKQTRYTARMARGHPPAISTCRALNNAQRE